MGVSLDTLISNGDLAARSSLLTFEGARNWPLALLQLREEYCVNAVAGNTDVIYVSSSTGNDANDGSTEELAVATLARARTLLSSLGSNTTIRLKNGDLWVGQYLAVPAGVNNVHITNYGPGNFYPTMIGCTRLAAGTSWTSAGNNRYFRSVTNFDTSMSLVLSGTPTTLAGLDYMRDRPFRRVYSTAAVEATPGSYFQSSHQVHVHTHDSVNPGTLDMWYRIRTLTTPNNSGIEIVDSDGCLIENVNVIGYGRRVTDQLYNIKVLSTGTNQNCIRDCRVYFNGSHHLIGTYTNTSGGITLFKNIEMGYCSHDSTAEGGSDSGTIGVSYHLNGNQEIYLWNLTVDGGQLDYATAGSGPEAVARVTGWYSHGATSPTSIAKIILSYNTNYSARAGNAISKGLIVDTPMGTTPSSRTAWDEYNVLRIKETVQGVGNQEGINSGWTHKPFEASINCIIDGKVLEAASNNGTVLGPISGLFINQRIRIYAPYEGGEFYGWGYGLSSNNKWQALWINPTIYFEWDGSTTDQTTANLKALVLPNNQDHRNSVFNGFFTQWNRAAVQPWLTSGMGVINFAPNATATVDGASGGYKNSAFLYFNPSNSAFPVRYGYNNSSGYVQLNVADIHHPILGIYSRPTPNSELVGAANWSDFDEPLQYDAEWTRRNKNTIGALETDLSVGSMNMGLFGHGLGEFGKLQRLQQIGVTLNLPQLY